MKIEEAALLPAMSRGGFGAAAYRSVMREMDRMRSLRLQEMPGAAQKEVRAEKTANLRQNRAALYHALGR